MTDALERFAIDYDTGTVLFEEGAAGHEMYVVQSGEIEISRQIGSRRQVLAVLAAGEFFGEMAIVNDRPRSATATVKERARLLVIDQTTFEAMLRARSEIAARLIKALAGRLERANQQVELLLVRDGNHRVVQCLRQLALEHGSESGAVYLPVSHLDLARRVSMGVDEVAEILRRLALAGLVVQAREAGIDDDGYLVPEVGQLLEFLEFLELKSRA